MAINYNKFNIIHVFLISLFPVLFIYSQNIDETPVQEIVLPALLILFGAVLLWLLTRFIIKNNEKQLEKNIWTKNSKGEKIIVCKTGSDNDEGRLIANTIGDIELREQAQHKEFAILYRTNAQSRAFEESLRKRNIAYKIYGGLSFYQRKEIKDLLAYYRLAINPNDEEAFKRIINYPTRGIGATTIQRLNVFANEHEKSIWEVINHLDETEININKGTFNDSVVFKAFYSF